MLSHRQVIPDLFLMIFHDFPRVFINMKQMSKNMYYVVANYVRKKHRYSSMQRNCANEINITLEKGHKDAGTTITSTTSYERIWWIEKFADQPVYTSCGAAPATRVPRMSAKLRFSFSMEKTVARDIASSGRASFATGKTEDHTGEIRECRDTCSSLSVVLARAGNRHAEIGKIIKIRDRFYRAIFQYLDFPSPIWKPVSRRSEKSESDGNAMSHMV
jgi:hypothetical protein